MTALGQSRKYARPTGMSALLTKAVIGGDVGHVREVHAISGHHGPADEEITLVARLSAAPPHTWHDPLVDEMVA